MIKMEYLAPTLLVFVTYCLSNTNALNIDISYPVIIKNSADGPNSFFGATVLLINEKDPGVIVGSPRSNSTLPSHKGIAEPGVVWQCSLTKSKCRVLVMDPTGNVNDARHPNVTDRKENGWLGGALVENADAFVACSSRWSNQFYDNQYFMNGMCNWRPKNDIFADPLPELPINSRLLPLSLNEGKQWGNIWGPGQAGFSIHSSPTTKEIILGAPGLEKWQGTMIRMSTEDRFNTAEVFDNSLMELNIHSYFGFAVSSGKFFRDAGSIQYVAGAPRHNDLKGHVAIFKMPLTGKKDILFQEAGPQIGSYYGSSICVADVNGDGWDDLLVGAPLQSTEHRIVPRVMLDQKQAVRGNGDEGAIFVYLSNNGNSLQLQKTNFNGHISWSRFGTAIATLGDIDNDGFTDIAVGAPYANEGTGFVYIFHGGKNGLTKEKSQIISAKSIDPLLRGFGYSISSGKDIDLNGYNDLAVGAYDSGHAVILRSKPLITVMGGVRSTINNLPFDTTTFEVESCILYVGTSAPQIQEFKIKIIADIQSRPQRVHLAFPQQGSFAAEHVYEEELYMGQESCTKFIAKVVRPIETSGKSVEIIQQVSISGSNRNEGPTVYHITRTFGDQVSTRVDGPGYQAFCKSCPLLTPSQTKLTSLKLPIAVDCGEDNKCVSDLHMGVKFDELKSIGESFMIGSSPVLSMQVTVENYGETAISPGITVLWNSRNLKKIPSECQSPSSNETFLEIKCTLGRTLEAMKSRRISFEFDMADITAGSLEKLEIHVLATTVSEVKNPDTTSKHMNIGLIAEADIFMEGSRSSAKFNLDTLSPKIQFIHSFGIALDGPSPIGGALVKFQIPASVEHSAKLKINFEVAEPITSSTIISCSAETESFTNFKAVLSRSMEPVESKTIEEDATTEDNSNPGSSSPFPDPDEVQLGGFLGRKTNAELVVECGSATSTVKCMTVHCRIGTMQPDTRTSIAFPLRIDSESLKKLFKQSKFTAMKFLSSGSSEMLGITEDIQPPNHKPDNTISISVIEEDIAKPVSHLIYLLGILIGFLILAIIVYCLYRFGVFERKKTTDEADGAESAPLQSQEKGDDADKKDEDEEDEV